MNVGAFLEREEERDEERETRRKLSGYALLVFPNRNPRVSLGFRLDLFLLLLVDSYLRDLGRVLVGLRDPLLMLDDAMDLGLVGVRRWWWGVGGARVLGLEDGVMGLMFGTGDLLVWEKASGAMGLSLLCVLLLIVSWQGLVEACLLADSRVGCLVVVDGGRNQMGLVELLERVLDLGISPGLLPTLCSEWFLWEVGVGVLLVLVIGGWCEDSGGYWDVVIAQKGCYIVWVFELIVAVSLSGCSIRCALARQTPVYVGYSGGLMEYASVVCRYGCRSWLIFVLGLLQSVRKTDNSYEFVSWYMVHVADLSALQEFKWIRDAWYQRSWVVIVRIISCYVCMLLLFVVFVRPRFEPLRHVL